jgi:hypothetical protein
MALSTTVFAVVDGVLFKPLTYPHADRLVVIEPGFSNLPAPPASASASLVRRAMGASVQDISDWQAAAPEAVITGIQAQHLTGMGEGVNETPFGVGLVQRNFFDTVGRASAYWWVRRSGLRSRGQRSTRHHHVRDVAAPLSRRE